MNLYVNHIFNDRTSVSNRLFVLLFMKEALFAEKHLPAQNTRRKHLLLLLLFCQYQNQKLFQVFQGQRTLVPICYG